MTANRTAGSAAVCKDGIGNGNGNGNGDVGGDDDDDDDNKYSLPNLVISSCSSFVSENTERKL